MRLDDGCMPMDVVRSAFFFFWEGYIRSHKYILSVVCYISIFKGNVVTVAHRVQLDMCISLSNAYLDSAGAGRLIKLSCFVSFHSLLSEVLLGYIRHNIISIHNSGYLLHDLSHLLLIHAFY